MQDYTQDDLQAIFQAFKSSYYNGVQGIRCLQGKSPGPVVGITACTHGNEPAGLAAFKYLLEEMDIATTLQTGTLFLVVNNIEATERYFATANTEEKKKTRFVDVDLNRLPKDTLSDTTDTRSEILRTRQLLPVLKEFETALDIHSTSQYSPAMIVACGGALHEHLVQGFPIDIVITNIDEIQVGKPISNFYGRGPKVDQVFGIECGSHEDQKTFQVANRCVLALLKNLDMVQQNLNMVEQELGVMPYSEYYIEGSIFFPNDSYSLVRIFKNFELVLKGTLLATGNGEAICAPFDCNVVFCPKGLKPSSILGEVMFLSRPVR